MPEAQDRAGLTENQRVRIQSEFRIPVDSTWPGTYWIICLDSESEMPTDDELAQIQSYLEFVIRRTYRESFARKLLEMPLPKCGGHNATILRKGWAHRGGWFYRASSWEFGPTYVPHEAPPQSLMAVLSLREDLVPAQWEQWKRDRPEIFPPPAQ
jgi:hypothetical protein